MADGAMMSLEQSAPVMKEKAVIKEGLSEYFIYTIEGTETIPNGWSKRLRSFEAREVPFEIQYRYREPEYGPQLVRMYLMRNDKDSELGTTPLPDGVFRVFRVFRLCRRMFAPAFYIGCPGTLPLLRQASRFFDSSLRPRSYGCKLDTHPACLSRR